jgi:hypothetical protein
MGLVLLDGPFSTFSVYQSRWLGPSTSLPHFLQSRRPTCVYTVYDTTFWTHIDPQKWSQHVPPKHEQHSLSLMFIPCIVRRGRNTQHSAQICTTALSYMLAPTCFGSSLPSSGSLWICQSHMKILPKIAGSIPAEAIKFFGRKNSQHACLRRGSKAVRPMSQICSM